MMQADRLGGVRRERKYVLGGTFPGIFLTDSICLPTYLSWRERMCSTKFRMKTTHSFLPSSSRFVPVASCFVSLLEINPTLSF